MSYYFADTSAIAKRYINEQGSIWMKNLVGASSKYIIILSDLAIVEFHSLLARHERSGNLQTQKRLTLQSQFMLHVAQEYIDTALTSSVLTKARNLLPNHPLRTLDAIQLASAMEASLQLNVRLTFLSSDKRLLNATSQEGFPVDNPQNYP